MKDERTRRALIGRYLAEPDVLAWRAWADVCEEAGNGNEAALWRFRAEHFVAVEEATMTLLRGFKGWLNYSALEVHTPHRRVRILEYLTPHGFVAILERASADEVVEVLRTRIEWDNRLLPVPFAAQNRRLRKRLLGLIDAAFAEATRLPKATETGPTVASGTH